MDPKKAANLYDDFVRYLANGDRSILKKYKISELKKALPYLVHYKGKPAYNSIIGLIEKGKNVWWRTGAFKIAIVAVMLGLIGDFFIRDHFYNKAQNEIPTFKLLPSDEFRELITSVATDEMPEMPLTVASKKGHHIYLGEPIGYSEPRGGYYEFPITLLNDNGKAYRIDIYDFLNEYEGKIVRVER